MNKKLIEEVIVTKSKDDQLKKLIERVERIYKEKKYYTCRYQRSVF